MVNKRKDCTDANFEHYKQSDYRKLHADTEIIIALLNKQPQKRLELIKSARTSSSNYSRYKRLFANEGILKKSDKGFSLWFYKEVPSLWDILVKDMKNASGHLSEIKIETVEFEDRNPLWETASKIYHKRICTRGFIVPHGATKLEKVLDIHITHSARAYLVVPVPVNEGEYITYLNKSYIVIDTTPILDGETFSYTIVKLNSTQR